MILITGAGGFVGSAALAALLPRGATVRAVVHRTPLARELHAPHETVTADLAEPASLDGICEGVRTVLHLGSYIGDDEETCERVNVRGTEALLAEAHRAGVRRILHLSTAAVYGDATHDGPAEGELTPAPRSVLSASRLAAEERVLAAGGSVLRPMFVFGPGDRWFVPPLARALAGLPVRVNGAAARISMTHVDDLAAAFASLALSPVHEPGVYHATPGPPVVFEEFVQALVTHLGVPEPTADIGFDDAVAFLSDSPALAQRLRMIAFDHHYDAGRLTEATGLTPGTFADRFAASADWYRAHLQETR